MVGDRWYSAGSAPEYLELTAVAPVTVTYVVYRNHQYHSQATMSRTAFESWAFPRNDYWIFVPGTTQMMLGVEVGL